jgi:hypothetical protein
LALLCGPGCGGKSATSSETKTKKAPTTKVPPVAEDDDSPALDSKDKEWGSWRWKGKRDLCYFVVDNNCFPDEKSACEAAECESGCVVNKGAPAKVTCKEFTQQK